MNRHLLQQLRSLARPFGRLAASWLLLVALLPLAQAAWAPTQPVGLEVDQICYASLDGTPHVMAAGQAGGATGDATQLDPGCQLCPQCVLGAVALATSDSALRVAPPAPCAPARSTQTAPTGRLARHGGQPRAPPAA